MKIGIVEDHFLNRKTIRQKIQLYPELSLLLEAENGEDFFRQLAEYPVSEHPDVVLIDLEMPVLDGIATISIASIRYPAIKFIVLTIFEDNDKIFEAIRAGASGYLLKEDKAMNIMDAIKNVVEFDGIPMSPPIARRAMQLLTSPAPTEVSLEKMDDYRLSTREIEVLKAIVRGESASEIAEQLFISQNTVRTHVNNIYRKLHLKSRSQIIKLAHKNKWL